MQPTTKLYAQFTNADWCVSGKGFEIQNEGEAIQRALQRGSICFNTFEVTSVTVGGKELKGDPENFSARRYVGIDKLYTRDEAIVVMQAETPYPGWNTAEFNAITRDIISSFRQKPANTVFMSGLERPGDFTKVEENEKVFDKKGQQLWPLQRSPAPKNISTPKF